jgi:hypothetical protein
MTSIFIKVFKSDWSLRGIVLSSLKVLHNAISPHIEDEHIDRQELMFLLSADTYRFAKSLYIPNSIHKKCFDRLIRMLLLRGNIPFAELNVNGVNFYQIDKELASQGSQIRLSAYEYSIESDNMHMAFPNHAKRIEYIDGCLLNVPSCLQVLDLSRTKLTKDVMVAIGNSKTIRSLKLYGYEDDEIVFCGLPALLQELIIQSKCLFSNESSYMYDCPHLQCFETNVVENLPDQFLNSIGSQLERFWFYGDNSSLRDFLQRMVALKSIWLLGEHQYDFSIIPSWIQQVKYESHHIVVPDELPMYSSLKKFTTNGFPSIEKLLERMPVLEDLWIDRSCFSHFTEKYPQLRKLVFWNGEMRFSFIQGSFPNLIEYKGIFSNRDELINFETLTYQLYLKHYSSYVENLANTNLENYIFNYELVSKGEEPDVHLFLSPNAKEITLKLNRHNKRFHLQDILDEKQIKDPLLQIKFISDKTGVRLSLGTTNSFPRQAEKQLLSFVRE